jgi:hypothetical protein
LAAQRRALSGGASELQVLQVLQVQVDSVAVFKLAAPA